MSSHNLSHLTFDDLDIYGYSVAGEETVVGLPQLDVLFDIGKAPDQLISLSHCLLTHGHMDHSAGIAYYLSHRKFCGQPAATVLAPANLVDLIGQILDCFGKLDGNRIPAKLIGVKPGDEYQLKPNTIARVFPTKHTRGAVGYCVIEKRKKLKPEYLGLNSRQIVDLKKKGVTIDIPVEIPLVSYLGDTQYVDFAQLDYVANSKILIAECTFFEEEHTERADAGRHMHIDEFAPLLERMNNETILITHLTQRTNIAEAKRMLKQKLSPATYKKVVFLMDRRYRELVPQNTARQ